MNKMFVIAMLVCSFSLLIIEIDKAITATDENYSFWKIGALGVVILFLLYRLLKILNFKSIKN